MQIQGPEVEELEEEIGLAGEMIPPDWSVYAMPVTKGQKRLWLIDQLNPGNPALNMPLMWRCTGPLDLTCMAQAFTALVERHESLRTTYDLLQGEVMGVIGGPTPVSIEIVDLGASPNVETSARARELITQHAAFRFDLRSGPLMKVKALRFGPANHLLLVTLHHIVCDGVSTGVVLRDVAEMYRALLDHSEPKLPALPLQLADFAVWQQQWRETQAYADSLNFWRNSLGTNFSRIEIRHDAAAETAAPSQGKQSGEIETLLLVPRLARKVQEFCKSNFITPNVFFSSVFTLLLSRISQQNDILIGSPCANRDLKTEQLVGMFMNIQAMRVRLNTGDTFQALIEKVQHWALEAYENQRLPFEDLIDDPYLSSESGGPFELPIFFLYQKSFMVTHHIGDLTIVPLRSMSPGAAFQIFFAVVDRQEEGTRLQWEYNPQKTRKDTIQTYLELYVALLEAAIDEPTALLDDVAREPFTRLLAGLSQSGTDLARQKAGVGPAAEHRNYKDPIDFQLVELWQATLGIPYISVDDGFFSLGVSSLTALRLIQKMNRIYSTDLGTASLFAASNIRAIAELIRDRLSPNMHSSLVPIQPMGTKPPLFVIHGVKGNILSFYGLAVHLGKDQPVYGIQAQALVLGERALLRMEDMAAYYIAEMRKVQPQGPYNLLGYSFGGMMALEMAHQLRAANQEVGLLGMLDSKSPEFLKALKKARAAQARVAVPVQISAAAGAETARDPDRLTRAERISQVVQRVRSRLIRISCQIATAFCLKTIPSFMKDPWSINYVANANYKPQVYDGRMTLFRAAQQPIPHPSEDLGWRPFFTEGVDVRELPGTHETLWTEQNIKTFADSVADSLRR